MQEYINKIAADPTNGIDSVVILSEKNGGIIYQSTVCGGAGNVETKAFPMFFSRFKNLVADLNKFAGLGELSEISFVLKGCILMYPVVHKAQNLFICFVSTEANLSRTKFFAEPEFAKIKALLP